MGQVDNPLLPVYVYVYDNVVAVGYIYQFYRLTYFQFPKYHIIQVHCKKKFSLVSLSGVF